MRRLLPLLILAGIFAWLWQQGDGGTRLLPNLFGERSAAGGDPKPVRHEELRIEIPGDATNAERRHGELIARYGDDAAAIQWVDDCLADRDLNDIDGADDRDWEYACWEAFAQAQESGVTGRRGP